MKTARTNFKKPNPARVAYFHRPDESLPVYLLGAAAGVSVATGGLLDAVVIMGVVVANGIIGYFTENDAEKTIDSSNTWLNRPLKSSVMDRHWRSRPKMSLSEICWC